MVLDRARERRRIDLAREIVVGAQHLQVAQRQQLLGVCGIDRVPAHLHAVLGRAHHGRSNALPGRQQRPGERPVRGSLAERLAEWLPHVAERLAFLAVDVLANPARENDAVVLFRRAERRREEKRLNLGWQRVVAYGAQNGIRHPGRHRVELGRGRRIADLPIEAGATGDCLAARLEDANAAVILRRQQTPANVQSCRLHDAAVFDDGEVGRSPADINIQQAARLSLGQLDGPGSVGGEQGLEMVAGAGTHKVAALGREQVGDGPCVVAPNRLTGQDDGAGIDVVRRQACLPIRVVHEPAEGLIVDALAPGHVWGQMDR